jgi:hypothetical protein
LDQIARKITRFTVYRMPLPFFDPSQLPCYYHADPVTPDFSRIPDGKILSPTEVPGNDLTQLALSKDLTPDIVPPPKPPPDACTVDPPGFVCTPMPAMPGDIVKCVPRMDHSDLKQLAGRVLPLTVSNSFGDLDNPNRADPRFSVYPSSHSSAVSRCCGGRLSSPISGATPLPCNPSKVLTGRFNDRLETHRVNPFRLGFKHREFHTPREDPSAREQAQMRDRIWLKSSSFFPKNFI